MRREKQQQQRSVQVQVHYGCVRSTWEFAELRVLRGTARSTPLSPLHPQDREQRARKGKRLILAMLSVPFISETACKNK